VNQQPPIPQPAIPQPPNQQPLYPPAAYSPAPAGPPQGLAITSMVLGIVGLFLGILLSIAAVITGHMAQKQQPHARAFWATGLITGYIGILLGLIAVVLVVVAFAFFFSFVAATDASNF
jgi:uncharacterized membrane protein